MTHQQLKILASLVFGRCDIGSLTFEQRNLVGIRTDPTNSAESRYEAQCQVERLFVSHLERRTENE